MVSPSRSRSARVASTRAHTCHICGKVGYGNGFQSSHGRAHVRRGEAVEYAKYYEGQISPSRIFIATGDTERRNRFKADGFWEVET